MKTRCAQGGIIKIIFILLICIQTTFASYQGFSTSISISDPIPASTNVTNFNVTSRLESQVITTFDLVIENQTISLGEINLGDQSFNYNLSRINANTSLEESCSSALIQSTSSEVNLHLTNSGSWQNSVVGPSTYCKLRKNVSNEAVVEMEVAWKLRIENYIGPDASLYLDSNQEFIDFQTLMPASIQYIDVNMDNSEISQNFYVGSIINFLVSDLYSPVNENTPVSDSKNITFEFRPKYQTLFAVGQTLP
ncbi:MAG: hypothetical protein GY909_15920 [Oligoflexia bacterium]|nr:hypothetical protein [Oligoflexia bacterium]